MYEFFSNPINDIILVLLAISTCVQVCDWLGFIPRKLRDVLKLNRSQDTLDVLKELGIDIDRYKNCNSMVGIPIDYSGDIEKDTEKNLKELKMDMKVSVGKRRGTELDYYIDLIGHSCDQKYAESYARILSTYWAKSVESGKVKNSIVDFVVTPKGGSPILGYELSKLMGKQFVLHEERERFFCEKSDMRQKFDCAKIPSHGAKALIVDDSTTGGRMVLETIDDLKKFGYEVTECLVVFEPQSKDARKKLENKGVNLLSVVKTHSKK